MQPRLKLDIGFRDLSSVFAPVTTGQRTLESEVATRFGVSSDVVAGLSARTLFDAALTVLNLPSGSGVIMSAVNIETMYTIAEAHGLKVHVLDIVAETLLPSAQTLEASLKTTGAKIVVIAQLYGAVSPLQDLAEVCRRFGALLIEDAAQAFSGDFHKGDAGADISLFSFGPIKRATALGGGLAVVRDNQRAAAMTAILAHWPRKSNMWLRLRAVKIALLKLASQPLIYGLIVGLMSLSGKDPDAVIGGMARGFKPDAILPQIRYQPPRNLLRLLARRLAQSHDYKRRRRQAVDIALGLPKGAVLPALDAQKHAYWLMPVLCSDPDDFVARARRQGIDVTRGTTSLRAFGSPREAPAAHNLIRRVVYWPL